jgi:mono/diheme cytochrome c family protein
VRLRWVTATGLALAAAAWLYWPSAAPLEVPEPDAAELAALRERGEYLFHLAGCSGCHTQAHGPLLAGGGALETPFGTFYAPNITPDLATGIGRWRAVDLVRALRDGRAPDGHAYLPVFPYPSYTHLHRKDMLAIYAYLRSVPTVVRPRRPAAAWYWRGGVAARAWQRAFFTPGDAYDWEDAATRGRYLATALGHCGECHTPRDRFGVPIAKLQFAGTDTGPDGDPVPNITPDREHGIGTWRASALRDFFSLGMKPDGDLAGGAMSDVIDVTTQYLTPEDTDALIAYLRAIPPSTRAPRQR